MKKTTLFSLAIIAAMILAGIILYPIMPSELASHWNAAGQVNGYIPKFWGLSLMPVIAIFIFGLFKAIPKIDPLKSNIALFQSYFDSFTNFFLLFLFYIYALTLFWNLGARFDFTLVMVPAFAGLFYYAGILIAQSKRNWFIGIRTPWTLESDYVWDKTHALGGKLFRAAGILSLSGLVFKKSAFAITIGLAIIAAVYSVIYSYLIWRNTK